MKIQRRRSCSTRARLGAAARSVRLGLVLAVLAGAPPVAAQVRVERTGSENPMKEIATSIIYGGLAGLVLGGATALAVEDNEESIIKWFVVGGTFFGFFYGVYHVTSRPDPHALVAVDDEGRAHVRVPLPSLSLTGRGEAAVAVRLLSVAF